MGPITHQALSGQHVTDLICLCPLVVSRFRQRLLPAWYAFRGIRAERRAVRWLADNSLIDDDAASRFLSGHPDPDLS